MKLPVVMAICVFTAFLAVVYSSCNKDNGKSSTKLKCVTCANGGLCLNDTCRCLVGYEGNACQTLTRQKYLGTWNVSEQGSTSPFSTYSITIQSNSSNPLINSVSLYTLHYYSFVTFHMIDAFLTADSIFIPRQQFANQYIVGKGYLRGDPLSGTGTITMRYIVTDTITAITDDFGYSSAVDSPSVWTR